MAKTDAKQGFNIRHRLVGAIVLLGLGVIFIPMILQGKGPGAVIKSDGLNEEVQEWIVGTEEAKTYTSRVRPVVDEPVNESIAIEPEAPPQLAEIDDVQPLKQSDAAQQHYPQAQVPEQIALPEPVQQAKLEQPQTEAPEPAKQPAFQPENVSRGWVVQVGTFSKPENAQNLIAKLDKNGFAPRYEVIDTDAGQATRVWVGPYEKRVTAGKASEQVREKTGVKGFIKSYP